MRFLKNREIMTALAVFAALTAAATTAAFFFGVVCGIFTLCVCVVFSALYFFFTTRRYNALSKLSRDIDRMLHNGDSLPLSEYSEGELSILYSELYKLTVTLREQSSQLQKEKVYLADSIADISHQIKNPLTSINLIISLLAKSELTDERRNELIKELYTLASHIDRLVANLLKLSQLDANTIQLKHEKTELLSLIRKACEPMLVPMELRGITPEISGSGDFYGDISWTGEAIGNIVKNCMEHTESGGKITITAEENALYSQIVISDDGSGIGKDDLPHIFERFYRGKSAANTGVGGIGIGLALAKTITVSQNGTLTAANNPEKGACFTMRFYKSVV